ncbi:glycosyltransferase family 9 protein [Candidatus Woesearchaeota archaeon]|nr:glycosyltransferase family 9 protein [Candidatus Woesearchaeota archaeon]
MDIDTERKIDYWVGVPLCALVSLFNSFIRLLGFHQPKPRVRRILFIELSEMGSSIIAYATLKKAQELYPGAQLYFLIFAENQSSVHLLNVIPRENVLTIRSRGFLHLTFDTLKYIWRCAVRPMDVAIDLELFSRFSSLMSYFSFAHTRVGFHKYHMEGLYRGDFQTHKIAYNPHQHIGISFLSMVYALQTPPQVPYLKKHISMEEVYVPQLPVKEETKKSVWEKLQATNPSVKKAKRIVLLNPNASKLLLLRKWPLQNYAALAKRLLADKDIFIVITGVVDEKPDAEAISRIVQNPRCIDFAGKTSFAELIALYNIADVLVTNDSGPAQFAAMTPIKSVVFFGPETPDLYKPVSKNCTVLYSHLACSPCVSAFNHRKSPCNDNVCVQVIQVNEAYQAVQKALSPAHL